jgi:hypothetical protein
MKRAITAHGRKPAPQKDYNDIYASNLMKDLHKSLVHVTPLQHSYTARRSLNSANGRVSEAKLYNNKFEPEK